jgi:hypothetical protein
VSARGEQRRSSLRDQLRRAGATALTQPQGHPHASASSTALPNASKRVGNSIRSAAASQRCGSGWTPSQWIAPRRRPRALALERGAPVGALAADHERVRAGQLRERGDQRRDALRR